MVDILVGETAHKERESQKPLNILLVEDESALVPLIKIPLNGHNVTVFDNAEQALEELRKYQESGLCFDWIITDKGLKGKMNGIDLAKAIKDEQLGNPFVTLFTASALEIQNNNSAQQLEEKGIHQIMGKPFKPSDFTNAVLLAREFGKKLQVPQA